VLADHCSDQTASFAAGLGARVCVRSEGYAGKAQALSWFVRQAQDVLTGMDIVTVLDADTLVGAEFCKGTRKAFGPGVEAVQSFVNPVSRDGFPLTTLVSYSEILSERIDDAARTRLRWSVPLRGTGMAFTTGTFARICERLGTQVDDIELSVRLAELGIPVHFDAQTIVNDPKSDHIMGLARQRGRWLRGQRQIWSGKQRQILKLLGSGLPNWSLIQAMLIKPKTALVIIKVALLGIFWAWPFGHTMVHEVAWMATLGGLSVDAVYYLSGLRFVEHAGRYLVSLLISPLLLVLWVISWGLSMSSGKGWLRARDE
jgi:cellulose synthase/poly-beta-1,6-N-acetylglucosamine synthase-like glycosyltransferase